MTFSPEPMVGGRLIADYPELRVQSKRIRYRRLQQAPKMQVLEVLDLNKLLRLNQQLYLTKDQIYSKSERSNLYFKKVLVKKKSWLEDRENATAVFLAGLVKNSQTNHQMLESIQRNLLPDLVHRSVHPRKQALEANLKLILKMESDFFRVIESTGQAEPLQESQIKSSNEPTEENPFNSEAPSSKENRPGRKRSLSNKRPKKPPMLISKTKGSSRKNTPSKPSAMSTFKESLRLCLDSDDPSQTSIRGDSQHPSQNSSHMVSRTDYSEPSKEMSESFDFKKKGGPSPGQLSKSISPNNRQRRRITFGNKAHYSTKKGGGELRGAKGGKAGPGEGSILSFKNFSVMSRADSIRNSHKKSKRQSGKKKKMNLQMLDTLSSSRESNKTEKKFETSTDEQKRSEHRLSIEKYNVYKDLRGKSKGFYSKRNSVVQTEKEMDFDMFDFKKQRSFGKQEDAVRASKETVKGKKSRKEAAKKVNRKKKRARKVVEKKGGIKVISKKK